MADIGVQQSTINYINTMQYSAEAKPAHFQRILDSIDSTDTAPSNATRITSASGLSNLQDGGLYLIDGNITVTSNIMVPSNCSIYVRGSIFKSGSGNTESHDDTIFDVSGSSNVNLIGVNNARIHSNGGSNGFKVRGSSSNVLIKGFFIENTWEAVNCRWGTKQITIRDCHIRTTVRRAVWFLGVDDAFAGRLFIDDAGWDAFDFDASCDRCEAFECFAIASGRWNGFVEEGARDCYFVRCIGVMKENPRGPGSFQLGWSSNGVSEGYWRDFQPRITERNYFIDCTSIEPSQFTGKGNGDYFYKQNTAVPAPRGDHFFWGCKALGVSIATGANVEWLNSIPAAGQSKISELTTRFSGSGIPPVSGNGSPFGSSPIAIPGTLQGEDFNRGGQGIAYSDTGSSNVGSSNYRPGEGVDLYASTSGGTPFVGSIASGEYLNYDIAMTTGEVNIIARVASASSNPGDLQISIDGNNLGTFPIGNTGGWRNFVDVPLPSGTVFFGIGGNREIRLTAVGGSFNLDHVRFERPGGGGVTPPVDWAQLEFRHSGKCVDNKGGNANGVEFHQWTCGAGSSAANRNFKFEDRGSGWWGIRSQKSNRCIDVAGGSMADGGKIHQWDCSNGNINQSWKIIDQGGGWFSLQSQRSSKCLEVSNGGTGNSAAIQQWGCTNSNHQQVKFR